MSEDSSTWPPAGGGHFSPLYRPRSKKGIYHRCKPLRNAYSLPTSSYNYSNHTALRTTQDTHPISNISNQTTADQSTQGNTLLSGPSDLPGQSPTITLFHPSRFGHPHEQAPPQATEPFWDQLPPWTRTETSLYYYPNIGYLDQPVYRSLAMDGKPLIMGYGTKSRLTKAVPHLDDRQNRGFRDMVDVFNGIQFIQSIPLQTLRRFSHIAKETFPTPAERAARAEMALTPGAEPGLHAIVSASCGARTAWADEVESSATDDDGQATRSVRSARSQTQSLPETSPTELSTPVQNSPGQSEKRRGKTPARLPNPQTIHRKIKRQLHLDLDAAEMPTNQAIHSTLKWMRDNGFRWGTTPLVDYAPPGLSEVPFAGLLDLYQAVLAFHLQPFPKRLRNEIYNRLTDQPPSISMLRMISWYIPIDDQVVARIINSIENYRLKKAYTKAQLDEFDAFKDQEGNETLKARISKVLNARREARESRETRNWERAAEKKQQDVQRLYGTRERSPEQPVQNSTPAARAIEASDAQNSMASSRRQRPRRAQKAKGKGKGGREVPGANY